MFSVLVSVYSANPGNGGTTGNLKMNVNGLNARSITVQGPVVPSAITQSFVRI